MVKGRRTFATPRGDLEGDFSFHPDGTCEYRGDDGTYARGRMVYCGLDLRFEVDLASGPRGLGDVFLDSSVETLVGRFKENNR